MLDQTFFSRDACEVARDLLGCLLHRRVRARAQRADAVWLRATIIETEAYYRAERASHSSLGRTPSREPMWADPGTIYVYHSRAGDSLNVSAGGPGDAVLIKAALPEDDLDVLASMRRLNPAPPSAGPCAVRPRERLCSGQALLCRSLDISRERWSGQRFDRATFYIAAAEAADSARAPALQTARLGIRADRDAHLPYRFVHGTHASASSRNPLRRGAVEGVDFRRLAPEEPAPPPAHLGRGTDA